MTMLSRTVHEIQFFVSLVRQPIKERKVIAMGKDVTECCPDFLIYTCLYPLSNVFMFYIVKDLDANYKIIISDSGVHYQHLRKGWLLHMNEVTIS
jgi:hypothetical protein